VEIKRSRALALGDLDSWRRRLCTHITSALPEKAARPGRREDRVDLKQRLDETFRQLGELILSCSDLPDDLEQKRLQTSKAVEQHVNAQRALKTLEQRNGATSAPFDPIKVASELARLNQQIQERKQSAQLLLSMLGRAALDAGIHLPVLKPKIAAINYLQSMIKDTQA
jgi:hypothetical protein